jgi:hypothetical protein
MIRLATHVERTHGAPEPEQATSGIRILEVTISSDRNKFVDRRIATKKLRNMPRVK